MSRQSWAPVDSTDAREQREADQAREAELHAQPVAVDEHDPRCSSGWLGEDPEGRPIPCLTCRPWLAQVPCWGCQARADVCENRRLLGLGRCCHDCDHHAPGAQTRR